MNGEWPKEQIPTVITNFPFTVSCSLMSTSLFLLLLPPTLSNHSSLKHCFLHVSPLLTKLPSFPVAHRNEVPNTSAWLSRPSWVWLYPDLSISLPSFLPPTPPSQSGSSLFCHASFAHAWWATWVTLPPAKVPPRHHFPNFSSPGWLLTSRISRTWHPYYTNQPLIMYYLYPNVSNFCLSWISYLRKKTSKHLKVTLTFSRVLSWIRQWWAQTGNSRNSLWSSTALPIFLSVPIVWSLHPRK